MIKGENPRNKNRKPGCVPLGTQKQHLHQCCSCLAHPAAPHVCLRTWLPDSQNFWLIWCVMEMSEVPQVCLICSSLWAVVGYTLSCQDNVLNPFQNLWVPKMEAVLLQNALKAEWSKWPCVYMPTGSRCRGRSVLLSPRPSASRREAHAGGSGISRVRARFSGVPIPLLSWHSYSPIKQFT